MNTKEQNKRKNKKGFQSVLRKGMVTVCFVSYLLSSNYAFANSHISNFQIRQETVNINGVLMSRPSVEDETIYKLLVNNNIHTPEEYAQWLATNIHYQKDGKRDIWAKPMEVLTKRSGDCEDFSFLNMAVLRVMGYKPKFLAFFSPNKSHSVCVFEDRGRYYYFDNMKLKEVAGTSVLEFAKSLTNNNTYIESKELDVDSRKWNLLYKIS